MIVERIEKRCPYCNHNSSGEVVIWNEINYRACKNDGCRRAYPVEIEHVTPFEIVFDEDCKIDRRYDDFDEKNNAFSKGDIAIVREFKPDGLKPFFLFYSSSDDLLGSLKKVDFDKAFEEQVIRRK